MQHRINSSPSGYSGKRFFFSSVNIQLDPNSARPTFSSAYIRRKQHSAEPIFCSIHCHLTLGPTLNPSHNQPTIKPASCRFPVLTYRVCLWFASCWRMRAAMLSSCFPWRAQVRVVSWQLFSASCCSSPPLSTDSRSIPRPSCAGPKQEGVFFSCTVLKVRLH